MQVEDFRSFKRDYLKALHTGRCKIEFRDEEIIANIFFPPDQYIEDDYRTKVAVTEMEFKPLDLTDILPENVIIR